MTYQMFKKAFFWNSLNVIAYKLLLQIHQYFLFYCINQYLFGTSGILFSTIYFCISITNFGFDYSLFAFHRYYIQSKLHFEQFKKQLITRIITLFFITLIIFFAASYYIVPKANISTSLLIICAIIFFTESLKKTLELFAQLTFLNRIITIIDLSMLCCYVTIIWSWFFIHHTITLYTLCIPMAIVSCIELCLISHRIKKYYETLPVTDNNQTISTTTIQKNQILNYCNQIAKAFFSPNFFIILISYHFSIIQTGFIKLTMDSIIVLYSLLHKAIGIPSAAIIATHQNFKTTLLQITNTYIQYLYALFFIFFAILFSCFTHLFCLYQPLIVTIIIFVTISLLEYLILVYEKLFLTHHKEQILAMINGASILSLICTLIGTNQLPKSLILAPFCLIRLTCTLLIIQISRQIWSFNPLFTPKAQTVLISFLIIIPTIVYLMLYTKNL